MILLITCGYVLYFYYQNLQKNSINEERMGIMFITICGFYTLLIMFIGGVTNLCGADLYTIQRTPILRIVTLIMQLPTLIFVIWALFFK